MINATAARIRCSNTQNITQSTRHLTTACSNALNKFRGAIEDYRVAHYKQEMPSRCRKDVIKAAAKGRDGVITIDGIEKMLVNICAEDKVSRKDVKIILSEIGGSKPNHKIHVDQMMMFLRGH